MKGRTTFTETEANKIRELLGAKASACRTQQKAIRNRLREIGFYISDFENSQRGFSVADFENLLRSGHINIRGVSSENSAPLKTQSTTTIEKWAQTVRERYKPNKINVLFVGESPPAGGTFFYFANSNLYKCISSAFNQVYNNKCGEGEQFLQFFSKHLCYLDDLCLQPVNNESDIDRLCFRIKGIDPLAERMKVMQPKAVIIVIRAIEPEVRAAVQKSGLASIIVRTTTFPSFSDANKKNCVSDIVIVLNELIESNILPKKLRC